MRRSVLLAALLLSTTPAAAAINPATVGYCVAISDYLAGELRRSGRVEMADRLAGANARLESLLDTPEERLGFEQAFEAAAPERFPPQRLDQALSQCSRAFSAT